MGLPRTNSAHSPLGGAMHQHSTDPGQANTTDNQHRTMPAVRRQRQQWTNKTNRALSLLQHHEPKLEHTDTARPTKGGLTHKHGKPQQRGGHAPAQQQPRRGKQHNRNRNSTDDDNPSPTHPHHAPPPLPTGRDEARPTRSGATNQRSTPHDEGGHTPTQHAPLRGRACSNTARPIKRGGPHQHRTNPGRAVNTATTATQPPTTATVTRRP